MDQDEFSIVISSRHRVLDLHFKETLRYRDLIFLLVKKDFTSRYKQTLLGPAWALIQPILSTLVFSFIFGTLAGLTTADIPGDFVVPSFLFYLIGNSAWHYFSTNLSGASNTFLANRATMGKVYYPRIIAPIATAISNLIPFGIQMLMFVVLWFIYYFTGTTSIQITPWVLLFPALVLQMMLLSTGVGLILSSITTKYRDLTFLIGFGLQLWQYACPIAYGLSLPSGKMGEWFWIYLSLNPMTPVVTSFRLAAFGFGYFNGLYYAIGWGVTLLLFLAGILLFNKTERTFMDTI